MNYEKVTTELVNDIVKVLSKEREKMAYHIQKQMLVTYWNIGKLITETANKYNLEQNSTRTVIF
jgi:hypothetical protein